MPQDTGKNIYLSETTFKSEYVESCEVCHSLCESGYMVTQMQFRKGMGNICKSWHFRAPSYIRLVYSVEKGEFTFQRNHRFIKPEK